MTDVSECWFFIVDVVDCAGALTSVASVFSNEGISVEQIAGRGGADSGGKVMVTFQADEEHKDIVVRKIKRLNKVNGLKEQKCDSDQSAHLMADEIKKYESRNKTQ